MNIGAVKHKSNGLEGEQRKEWFELIIRPPFMQSATFSMHKNKNKQNPNEPDYKIWTNYNRKGENFRGVEVGAIWKKVSRDGKTTYLTGTIESPAFQFGKLNFALFETKVFSNETAADIDWIYDVNWNPPQSRGSNQQQTYTEPVQRDIPIQYENAQGQSISQEEANQYM